MQFILVLAQSKNRAKVESDFWNLFLNWNQIVLRTRSRTRFPVLFLCGTQTGIKSFQKENFWNKKTRTKGLPFSLIVNAEPIFNLKLGWRKPCPREQSFCLFSQSSIFWPWCPTICDITKFSRPKNLLSNHHVFSLKDNQLSEEPSCLKFEKTNNVIGQVLWSSKFQKNQKPKIIEKFTQH